MGEWYRQEVGAPELMLHRGTLQRLPAAAVPPESIRLDHRVVSLSDEPGGVRLHFGNGDDVVAAAADWLDSQVPGGGGRAAAVGEWRQPPLRLAVGD